VSALPVRVSPPPRLERYSAAPADDSVFAKAAAVLAIGAVLRLVFAVTLPLFPDEAYYWEWSRRLAAGYYDHPPAIALLIRAGTELFGDTTLGVRFFSVLAGLAASVATAAAAKRLGGDRAALWACVIITSLPLAAAGLVLATPDAPLLAATAGGVYTIVRAVQSPPRSREALVWWMLTGAACGLAFSSKYTSILLPAGATIAMVSRPGLRARLRDPGPYLAVLVALIVFLPTLVWNSRHGWLSFGFQLRHGFNPPNVDLFAPLKRLPEFIGGQAGLVSPILFVFLAVAVIASLRRRSKDVPYLLATIAAFGFLLFCVSATRRRVEPNWPGPVYVPAAVLLGVSAWSRKREQWLKGGLWFATIMSGLIYLHAAFGILPIPVRKDPIARSAGWRTLAERTHAARVATTDLTGASTWIAADRYQDASEIAFNDLDHPTTFSTNLSGRANEYDLWPRFPDLARPGDNLVLVLDESDEPLPDAAAALQPHFTILTRGELVELRAASGVVGTRRLWILRGWRGGWSGEFADSLPQAIR
jgi:Dolichyl-phosphate-mannose-protein mannosyltransferase